MILSVDQRYSITPLYTRQESRRFHRESMDRTGPVAASEPTVQAIEDLPEKTISEPRDCSYDNTVIVASGILT
jgi:hypothetical protein